MFFGPFWGEKSACAKGRCCSTLTVICPHFWQINGIFYALGVYLLAWEVQENDFRVFEHFLWCRSQPFLAVFAFFEHFHLSYEHEIPLILLVTFWSTRFSDWQHQVMPFRRDTHWVKVARHLKKHPFLTSSQKMLISRERQRIRLREVSESVQHGLNFQIHAKTDMINNLEGSVKKKYPLLNK